MVPSAPSLVTRCHAPGPLTRVRGHSCSWAHPTPLQDGKPASSRTTGPVRRLKVAYRAAGRARRAPRKGLLGHPASRSSQPSGGPSESVPADPPTPPPASHDDPTAPANPSPPAEGQPNRPPRSPRTPQDDPALQSPPGHRLPPAGRTRTHRAEGASPGPTSHAPSSPSEPHATRQATAPGCQEDVQQTEEPRLSASSTGACVRARDTQPPGLQTSSPVSPGGVFLAQNYEHRWVGSCW